MTGDSLDEYIFRCHRHLLTEAKLHAWNYFIQTAKKESPADTC